MKKKLNHFFSLIDYSALEYFSYLLLILWVISPIIEYILKNFIHLGSSYYFAFIKYLIGIYGFIEYTVYISKKKNDNKLHIKQFIPHILILILLVLSIISSIFAYNPELSFFGESYRREGLIVYVTYIGIILLASIIKDKKYVKNLFKLIIFSCLFITILPLINRNFTFIEYSNIYHQFNHYGYYLMISCILAGFMFIDNDKFRKIMYYLIFIFILYILIRNNTFGCYLSILVCLIFLVVYSFITKHKKGLDIIVLLFTFIFCSFLISHFDIKYGERVNFSDTHGIVWNNFKSLFYDFEAVSDKDKEINHIGTGRGLLWKAAWEYTLEHPLIGGGMENLKYYYYSKKIYYNDRPHNCILQVSSFIGIPGALIYITLMSYLGLFSLRNIKKDTSNLMIYTVTACYFISSLFGNSMYYTSPYFMIFIGLLISVNFSAKSKN